MTAPAQAYAEALIDKIKELEPKDGKQRYTLLGAPAFMGPATQAVELDMATMDGICIPIALFILWFMLRTWRLMLLPLATVVVSALVAFATVYAISLKARVFTVVVRARLRSSRWAGHQRVASPTCSP